MKNDLINMINFWTGTEFINLQYLDDQKWSPFFDSFFGPCYTIDIAKIFIQTQGMIQPTIEIILTENFPWNKVNILFHTKHDLPDSIQMNGWNSLLINNTIKQQHMFNIQKIKSTRDSTRSKPCTKFERETCQNFEDNSLLSIGKIQLPISNTILWPTF